MSQPNGIFEQILASNLALIAAVEANTAALSGGAAKGATTSTKTTTTKNTKTEKAGPKFTKEQTVAAVVALKDAAGAPAARELLAKHGVDKVANVKPEQHDAVYEDAVAALEAFNESQAGGEEANDDI
jgi:hypothetical protein